MSTRFLSEFVHIALLSSLRSTSTEQRAVTLSRVLRSMGGIGSALTATDKPVEKEKESNVQALPTSC